MKTSELKKWAEDNGFKKEMLEESIKSFDLLNNLDELQKKMGIQLIRKVLDYIETPLNEREDEKKYQLKVNEFNKRIIGVDYIEQIKTTLKHTPEGNQKFIFDNKDTFTQSEIDNLPQEIKGAIECGFLRKVEVE